MDFSLPFVSGLNIYLFILVFMRMSGAFIFNPILGRENIPVNLRAALGLLCAIIITPTLSGVTVQINSFIGLIAAGLGELFIGLALGVIVSIIVYVVQFSGELIDMQMGLTMAQMYDSSSGVNMPLFGSIFNLIIVIVFFASNAHIALISFFNDSFRLIAPGTFMPTMKSMQFIVSLGTDYFDFGFRMALPVVAIEVIAHFAIGMLMRAVPSINIFSIGMCLAALIGIILIFVTTTAIVTMCGQLLTFMLEKAAEYIKLVGT
jgi:flagellar biosynthetic protein FliR